MPAAPSTRASGRSIDGLAIGGIGEMMRGLLKYVAFALVPLLLLAGLFVELVGPRNVVPSLQRLGGMTQTNAGKVEAPSGGAVARDLRFGIAEGQKNQASKA